VEELEKPVVLLIPAAFVDRACITHRAVAPHTLRCEARSSRPAIGK
tara:strand:+ start:338 stop:475 length:138 start_codon:yes stop_codon:yes gene_type:complete